MSRLSLQPVLDEFLPLYLKLMNDFAYSNARYICSCSTHDVSDYSICRDIAVHLIDKFYPLLTSALTVAANCTVPRVKHNFLKHWWSNELQVEKNKSIESHRLWVSAGRPRCGPIFDIYKTDKYAYKLAVHNAKNDSALSITNDLHDALSTKDTSSFWKIWHAKFNSKNPNKPKVVGGLVDEQAIADGFAELFHDTCKPNSTSFNDVTNEHFNLSFRGYLGDYLDKKNFFTVEQICKVICELKFGKASGADGVAAEHIVHCHQSGHLLITYLCNLILLTGHVPPQFG